MKIADDLISDAEAALAKKDYHDVVALTTRAIEFDPKCENAYALRGAVLLSLGSYFLSILDNDRAIEINKASFAGLHNRACCYIALNMIDEAAEDLMQLIDLYPKRFEPHFQMGVIYASIHDLTLAEKHFREAVRLDPTVYVTQVGLSHVLLGAGKWQDVDLRQFEEPIYKEMFSAPYWQGEDLSGKHIMFFMEAGQGDHILSLRYVNLVRKRYPTARITIKVPKNFQRLVSDSFTVGVSLQDVKSDYVCSLLNMPKSLGLTWDTVPCPERYLFNCDVNKWRKFPPGLNVGVCWISQTRGGRYKVIPSEALKEMGKIPDVNFISLQVPPRPCNAINMIEWTCDDFDWADTASLIGNLDLVISVDSGVAHLAGALGKPVWTLVTAYWPWMHVDLMPTPEHCIWYPSMRLFRQNFRADMTMPINRMIVALRRLAHEMSLARAPSHLDAANG